MLEMSKILTLTYNSAHRCCRLTVPNRGFHCQAGSTAAAALDKDTSSMQDPGVQAALLGHPSIIKDPQVVAAQQATFKNKQAALIEGAAGELCLQLSHSALRLRSGRRTMQACCRSCRCSAASAAQGQLQQHWQGLRQAYRQLLQTASCSCSPLAWQATQQAAKPACSASCSACQRQN
jgi:hypothetical protein